MIKYLTIAIFALLFLTPSYAFPNVCTFPEDGLHLWKVDTTLSPSGSFTCDAGSATSASTFVVGGASSGGDTNIIVGTVNFTSKTSTLGLTTATTGWDNVTEEDEEGQLRILNGTLTVPAGVTLRLPGGLRVEGGVFKSQGSKIGEARIESIDWANSATSGTASYINNIKIVFDRDVANLGLTTDMWLVMMDEDPYGVHETLTGKSIQSGDGNTNSSTHRPSYAKWKWLDVTAISTTSISNDTVNADLDPWEGTANEGGNLNYNGVWNNSLDFKGGTPYMGKRGIGLKDAAALTYNEPQWFNLTSALKVAGLVDLIDSDLGSQYVEFVTGACDGKLAKIVNVEAMGTTSAGPDNEDIIYVAGDTTECGTTGSFPNVIIHPGFRKGDRVALVNPATLDFSRVATPTNFNDLHGYFLWMGGTVEMEWTRLIRMGALHRDILKNDLPVNLTRACSLCIAQKSGTVSPVSGYIRNTDIGSARNIFTGSDETDEHSLDTGHFYPVGGAYGDTDCSRFENTTLELGGIEFDRLYIHDSALSQAVSGTGGGMHGIWIDRVNDINVSRVRIERISDDGFGYLQESCGENVNQRLSLNQFLVYENMALPDNSQENTSFNMSGYGFDGKSESERYYGEFNVGNLLTFGSVGPPFNNSTSNGSFKAILAGQPNILHEASVAGINRPSPVNKLCRNTDHPVDCCTDGGTTPATADSGTCHSEYSISDANTYIPVLKNSMLVANYASNDDGTTDGRNITFSSWGKLLDSLVINPSFDNSLGQVSATTLSGFAPRMDGSLYAITNAQRFVGGATTGCTDAVPVVNYYSRSNTMEYIDSLIFAPYSGAFGNQVDFSSTNCVGLADLLMKRTYIVTGGDGSIWSMGNGLNDQNSGYFKSAIAMNTDTTPMPSASITDSTLSYPERVRFSSTTVNLTNESGIFSLQTSWGCDESAVRCSLSDRPDGTQSIYSGLCTSTRRNDHVASSYDEPGNYGSITNGFSKPSFNNSITPFVGPAAVIKPYGEHTPTNDLLKDITGVTIGTTTDITSAGHGYSINQLIRISDITGSVGTDVLNGNIFRVGTLNGTDEFELLQEDGSAVVTSAKVYTSGGTLNRALFRALLEDNDFYIADFIQPDGAGGCEKSRPKRLGFSDWEVSHSMMGDLMTEQWRSYSTDDLGLEIVPGS
jgi:hypothetical protein